MGVIVGWVGCKVGSLVGSEVGSSVGENVGDSVGIALVGISDGGAEGSKVGLFVNSKTRTLYEVALYSAGTSLLMAKLCSCVVKAPF